MEEARPRKVDVWVVRLGVLVVLPERSVGWLERRFFDHRVIWKALNRIVRVGFAAWEDYSLMGKRD